MDGYIALGHTSCPNCQDGATFPRYPGVILAAFITNVTREGDQVVYFRASGASGDLRILQSLVGDAAFTAQWGYIATWPCMTSSNDITVVSLHTLYMQITFCSLTAFYSSQTCNMCTACRKTMVLYYNLFWNQLKLRDIFGDIDPSKSIFVNKMCTVLVASKYYHPNVSSVWQRLNDLLADIQV